MPMLSVLPDIADFQFSITWNQIPQKLLTSNCPRNNSKRWAAESWIIYLLFVRPWTYQSDLKLYKHVTCSNSNLISRKCSDDDDGESVQSFIHTRSSQAGNYLSSTSVSTTADQTGASSVLFPSAKRAANQHLFCPSSLFWIRNFLEFHIKMPETVFFRQVTGETLALNSQLLDFGKSINMTDSFSGDFVSVSHVAAGQVCWTPLSELS